MAWKNHMLILSCLLCWKPMQTPRELLPLSHRGNWQSFQRRQGRIFLMVLVYTAYNIKSFARPLLPTGKSCNIWSAGFQQILKKKSNLTIFFWFSICFLVYMKQFLCHFLILISRQDCLLPISIYPTFHILFHFLLWGQIIIIKKVICETKWIEILRQLMQY